jgi:hypothetical protein
VACIRVNVIAIRCSGGLLISGRRPKSATRDRLMCGRMEAYLWGLASLFRSILAHISHSNKPPLGSSPLWQ